MELLCVMWIIGIALALLLPTVSLVNKHVKKTRARGEVKMIETAWKNYLKEYKTWPANVASGQVALVDDLSRAIEGVLDSTNNNWNPRHYAFMEFNAYDPLTNPVNPWNKGYINTNNYYYVQFDLDYDNMILAPDSTTVHRSVIVWTIHDNELYRSWGND